MWVKVFKIYIYLSILHSHVFLEGRNTETYIWGRMQGGGILGNAMRSWSYVTNRSYTEAFTHEKETIFFFPKIKGQI